MRLDMRVTVLLPTLPLALVLGLAATRPAAAGELIRYRGPDGSVGFVDDEKRLPPGVEVVSRTPIERAPAPAPPPVPRASEATAPEPGQAPAPPTSATPEADADDCDTLASPLERIRCVGAREARCSHFGLSPGCEPAQIAAARDWCARGEALRAEIADVTDERDAARERHEACLRRGEREWRCDGEALEEAERAALVAERRVEALEAQCHEEGCLPGWVREGCTLEPDA
jgi:hypothetical protein